MDNFYKLKLSRKFLALFFVLFSFSVNAQINNNAFKVFLSPNDIGTCVGSNNTADTALIIAKKATMNSLQFTYTLPVGIEYVAGSAVINSQSGSGDFAVTEEDISNLNSPVFKIERAENANWQVNDQVKFSIMRTALCESVGYLNSGGIFKDKHCITYIDNGNSRLACDEEDGVSSYDLLAASLSIQSIETLEGSSGDSFTRNVSITQGGNGSITFFNYYIVVGQSVDDVYQLS